MRSRWLWLLAIFLVFTSGCAFDRAIDAGHALVEARQYRAALAEYERALRLDPDSGEARALVGQITPYALNEAEADMKAELDKSAYEAAMRHVAYVRRYDQKRADKLSERVELQMRTHTEALMAKGDMEGAYPLAVRTARLFPNAVGINATFRRLRAHFMAQAEQRAALGQYAEALASLDIIEKHEPAMAATLEPTRAKIRGIWADTVVAKAQAAEAREELGAAAALYGRAFEIAGRSPDGDAMRRLVRELRADGLFHVDVAYDGDVQRRSAVATRAAPKLDGIEGVVLGSEEDGASMRVAVHAGPASCGETFSVSTRSKDYVAGTRQVRNPAYDRLSVDIDNLTAEINVLSGKVSAKKSEVDQLDSRLRRCEERRSRASGQGGGGPEPPSCSEISGNLSTAKSELSSLSSQLSSAESQLAGRISQRSSTSQTLTEDIIETFTYEVRHNTRRCGLTLSVSLEPAWSGVEKHQVRGEGVTADDSHAGFATYGVALDPLSYPRSDAELISRADSDAVDGLVKLVGGKVADYYRAMTDRALETEATDVAAAADMMVAIVAAGRKHLDGPRVSTLGTRLHARFGLESIDTLRK